MATCPEHPTVTLRCPACAGTQGGKSTSPKKVTAAKRNGRKGGRPRSFLGINWDLSMFPCADCGEPAQSEHYDPTTERLLKLCATHKADRKYIR